MASCPDDSSKRKHVESEEKCVEERGRGSQGEHCGRGYSREDTPPAPCSVLCGPRSCSTLPSTLHSGNEGETSPPEPKRRRLWGLRGLVKMFRRRVRRKGGDPSGSPQGTVSSLRARSASELTVDASNRSNAGPYNQGLSVSHDSVFSPESPTETSHTAPPALALATRGVNMSELKAALRRRRGDSGSGDDDPGLPRSPPTSPTTLDVLNHGLKSSSRTTRSTCSDGSLLSMGSSENDEDSFGALSHHSSKASLSEGRHHVIDKEPAAGIVPLSHKAAMHKISVRPKRSYGIPPARRKQQILQSSLPATPEVNEDSTVRSGFIRTMSYPQQPLHHQQGVSSGVTARHSVVPVSTVEAESKLEDRRVPWKDSDPSPSWDTKDDTIPSQPTIASHTNNQWPEYDDSPQVEEERRLSRDKRKDPFRSSAGIKSSRLKSDPYRFSSRREDTQTKDVDHNEKNGSCRSSSVEGRLEGNSSDRAAAPSKAGNMSFVSTHQAIRNVLANTSRQETIHTPPSPRMEMDSGEVTLRYNSSAMEHSSQAEERIANRLSSSVDSLDSDDAVVEEMLDKKIKTQSINSLESGESTSTLGGRSSTDSLTMTPLPGIYIRSSQNKSKLQAETPKRQSRFSEQSTKNKDDYMEVASSGSGPLSLDSSLTVVHVSQIDEEKIRKALSVDEVGRRAEAPLSSSNRRSMGSVEPVSSSKNVTVLRSVSVNSPSSTMSSSRSRKSSIGDDLESDTSLPRVTLRPVKRESSDKKPQEVSNVVPEFMRIQLNRVESRGNIVVFDNTEKEQPPKPISETFPITDVTGTTSEKEKDCTEASEIEELERSKESSEIVIEHKTSLRRIKGKMDFDTVSHIIEVKGTTEIQVASKVPDTQRRVETQVAGKVPVASEIMESHICNKLVDTKGRADAQYGNKVSGEKLTTIESNLIIEEPESKGKGEKHVLEKLPSGKILKTKGKSEFSVTSQSVEGSASQQTNDTLKSRSESFCEELLQKDEIVLRRPSVVDRAAVLDQAVTSSQQPVVAPVKMQDQPELFKVFARRSFKLKDAELEATLDHDTPQDVKIDDLKEVRRDNPLPDLVDTKGKSSCATTDSEEKGESSVNSQAQKVEPFYVVRGLSSKRFSFGGNIALSTTVEPDPIGGVSPESTTRKESLPASVEEKEQESKIHLPKSRIVPSFMRSQTLTQSGRRKQSDQEKQVVDPAVTSVSEGVGEPLKQGTDLAESQERRGSSYFSVVTPPHLSKAIETESTTSADISITSSVVKKSGTNNINRFSGSPSDLISSPVNSPPSNCSYSTPRPVVWPPRSVPRSSLTDPTQSFGSSPASTTSSYTPPSKSVFPSSKILSSFSESFESSSSRSPSQVTDNLSVSKGTKDEIPVNVGSARRRFMSAGTADQLSINKSLIESIDQPTRSVLTEARNTSVAQSFDVKSQSSPSGSILMKKSPVSLKNDKTDDDQALPVSSGHRKSIGGTEDWRVLVRQRREDRMKQTKTSESEDIIIETRPNVARNSKVLEMANNFQKLQVA